MTSYDVSVCIDCAAAVSGVPHEVVTAVDINPVANDIYRLNFPTTKLVSKCLTVSYVILLFLSLICCYIYEMCEFPK